MRQRAAGDVNTPPLVFYRQVLLLQAGQRLRVLGKFVSKRVLLTAAHCVRNDENGDFWKNITFFLQYDKGRASAKYTQNCIATFNSWVQPGNEKYLSDFAMIQVNADSKTGWFGTQWDWQGTYKAATKIGYPMGISDGEVIQVLPGPIQVSDGLVALKHGDPNKQGGSSGGAWIGDYDTKGDPSDNHVISVKLFNFADHPASTTARISTTASRSSTTM